MCIFLSHGVCGCVQMVWWTAWILTAACRAHVKLSPSAVALPIPSTLSARTNRSTHSKPLSHSISESASSSAQRARTSLTETTPSTGGETALSNVDLKENIGECSLFFNWKIGLRNILIRSSCPCHPVRYI